MVQFGLLLWEMVFGNVILRIILIRIILIRKELTTL